MDLVESALWVVVIEPVCGSVIRSGRAAVAELVDSD